jgi:hypothetical protein
MGGTGSVGFNVRWNIIHPESFTCTSALQSGEFTAAASAAGSSACQLLLLLLLLLLLTEQYCSLS